MKTKLFKHYTI